MISLFGQVGVIRRHMGNQLDTVKQWKKQLADEFEGGRIARNRGLRESWLVGFIDHLFERGSEFEDD